MRELLNSIEISAPQLKSKKDLVLNELDLYTRMKIYYLTMRNTSFIKEFDNLNEYKYIYVNNYLDATYIGKTKNGEDLLEFVLTKTKDLTEHDELAILSFNPLKRSMDNYQIFEIEELKKNYTFVDRLDCRVVRSFISSDNHEYIINQIDYYLPQLMLIEAFKTFIYYVSFCGSSWEDIYKYVRSLFKPLILDQEYVVHENMIYWNANSLLKDYPGMFLFVCYKTDYERYGDKILITPNTKEEALNINKFYNSIASEDKRFLHYAYRYIDKDFASFLFY